MELTDRLAAQELVMGMHARAAQKKDSMSNRTEVMLELVLDIKNNRQPKGGGAISTESLLGQGSLRWLRESRVAEVQLRSVNWPKLLAPRKKVLSDLLQTRLSFL